MTIAMNEFAARYVAVWNEPDPVSGGVQFLLLDTEGRVRFDYQFIDF